MSSDGESLRCGGISSRGGIPRLCCTALGLTFAALTALAGPVAPPPPAKLYHGFYFGGIGTDTHDQTDHDSTPQDSERYTKTERTKGRWIYVSDTRFVPRKLPG